MRLNFSPRNQTFFQFFIKQAETACETAEAMQDVVRQPTIEAEKLQRVVDLEHRGDELVHDVTLQLNKTFVTPIDREDIHLLSTTLDDIMDFILGAAMRFTLFKITAPTEPALQLAEVLVESTRVIRQAVETLPQFKDVSELRKKMRELEKKGDQINRGAIAQLFEGTTPVIDVIKWKEIYESLEEAIDRCEDAFDIIEGVIVKHA
ncbi:MAG: DUF47 domain-containing protein [Candidatus Xenobia bacterium]